MFKLKLFTKSAEAWQFSTVHTTICCEATPYAFWTTILKSTVHIYQLHTEPLHDHLKQHREPLWQGYTRRQGSTCLYFMCPSPLTSSNASCTLTPASCCPVLPFFAEQRTWCGALLPFRYLAERWTRVRISFGQSGMETPSKLVDQMHRFIVSL